MNDDALITTTIAEFANDLYNNINFKQDVCISNNINKRYLKIILYEYIHQNMDNGYKKLGPYPYNLITFILGEKINYNEFTQDNLDGFEEAFNMLTEREKNILLMRFKDNMTYKAIGTKLNISVSRVAEIQRDVLKKLRYPALLRFIVNGKFIEDKKYYNKIKKEKKLIREQITQHERVEAMHDRRELVNALKRLDKYLGYDIDYNLQIDGEESDAYCNLLIPIENCYFTNRIYNCLKRNSINTLGDIVNHSKDLKFMRNLGKKSINEIIIKLKYFGLEL